jgi:predicted small metal-binding protein
MQITRLPDFFTRYDLSVKDQHNFVANGVVVHNSSAHVSYNHEENRLTFFSGGSKHENFVALFNQETLLTAFSTNSNEHPTTEKLTVYGEAYGGKLQGMSKTYGPNLKFVAFEVLINDKIWLSVPQAEKLATQLGFEFVPYEKIETTEEAINKAAFSDSVQAARNGMGQGLMREGVVLRPLVELTDFNGGIIRVKHKRPEFAEREHTPKFSDPDELQVLQKADEVANEWVTHMRLVHVLDAFPDPDMKDMVKIIQAMIEDVSREGANEIVDNKATRKAIGKKTVKLFKDYLFKYYKKENK